MKNRLLKSALALSMATAMLLGAAVPETAFAATAKKAEEYTPKDNAVELSSVSIGGVTYYYTANEKLAADSEIYFAAKARGQVSGYTVFDYSELTQIGTTGVYYAVQEGATPIETLTKGKLYGWLSSPVTKLSEIYTKLGVKAAAQEYDAISSATTLSSFHAGDISNIIAVEDSKIVGKKEQGSIDAASAKDYVAASILKAAGKELSAEQSALVQKITLKDDPTNVFETKGTVVVSSAALAASNYGDYEFDIVPDDTVSGYVWNNYWKNVYAATISNGVKVAGAVHWIDLYGENTTNVASPHYNKIQIALNNGTAKAKNEATVKRFADFYKNGSLKAGTYTITVYAEGYNDLVATVDVSSEDIKAINDASELTAEVAKTDQVLSVATTSKTFTAATLKKKNVGFKIGAKATAGTITCKKTSGNAKITVSKAGKVTVKKGLKKGTYKVKVNISVAETAGYNALSKTKTITVKVK